ncbi:hypothetical protein DFJ73DRAFT_962939 [Zopfochytrium polystomum]|nr:hypothetical protein DFJ73DRAFT_962939 [Zopfochytrium polystomum]
MMVMMKPVASTTTTTTTTRTNTASTVTTASTATATTTTTTTTMPSSSSFYYPQQQQHLSLRTTTTTTTLGGGGGGATAAGTTSSAFSSSALAAFFTSLWPRSSAAAASTAAGTASSSSSSKTRQHHHHHHHQYHQYQQQPLADTLRRSFSADQGSLRSSAKKTRLRPSVASSAALAPVAATTGGNPPTAAPTATPALNATDDTAAFSTEPSSSSSDLPLCSDASVVPDSALSSFRRSWSSSFSEDRLTNFGIASPSDSVTSSPALHPAKLLHRRSWLYSQQRDFGGSEVSNSESSAPSPASIPSRPVSQASTAVWRDGSFREFNSPASTDGDTKLKPLPPFDSFLRTRTSTSSLTNSIATPNTSASSIASQHPSPILFGSKTRGGLRPVSAGSATTLSSPLYESFPPFESLERMSSTSSTASQSAVASTEQDQPLPLLQTRTPSALSQDHQSFPEPRRSRSFTKDARVEIRDAELLESLQARLRAGPSDSTPLGLRPAPTMQYAPFFSPPPLHTRRRTLGGGAGSKPASATAKGPSPSSSSSSSSTSPLMRRPVTIAAASELVSARQTTGNSSSPQDRRKCLSFSAGPSRPVVAGGAGDLDWMFPTTENESLKSSSSGGRGAKMARGASASTVFSK